MATALPRGGLELLELDPAIRNWILFPLTIILILAGLLRHYAALLLISPPKTQPLKVVREQTALSRGVQLRMYANRLPLEQFEMMRADLIEKYEKGSYLKEPLPSKELLNGAKPVDVAPSLPPNPLTDPGGMDGIIDMMKKQAVSFIPQTILMYYISYFYESSILTRLPFPLTLKFKSMLQRGLDAPELPANYVTAVAWYFLCLFGLGSVYRLILGGDNAADGGGNAMANPAAMAMTMPGQPAQDFMKLYKAEKENLEMVEHIWVCDGVEARLLKKNGVK